MTFLFNAENGSWSLSKGALAYIEERVSFRILQLFIFRSSSFSSFTIHRYEEAKRNGVHTFDRELEDLIEKLIVECERKIQRALKRLSDEDAKAAVAISVSEVTQAGISHFFYFVQ